MRNVVCTLVAGAYFVLSASAQPQQKPGANARAVYKELRGLAVGGESYQVTDLVLAKDAASFTLSGTLHLLPAVNGKVTGAVFLGKGSMAYAPPIAAERSMLANLTRGEAFNETFEKAVFRFTDDTADKIKAAAAGKGTGSPSQAQDALKEVNDSLRLRLKENLHARILHDVMSPSAGALFHAYLAGKKYSGKLVYMVDPRGAGFVAPEEIQLFSWADNKEGIFAAHHYSDAYRKTGRAAMKTPGGWMDIQHQVLDTNIDQTAELSGRATTSFAAQFDGLSAVPFSLFPTLRVSSVTDAAGAPLEFIQEAKEEDADLWVLLPRPLSKGEKFTVVTTYKGKDAVSPEGQDNFYPVARANWYPNNTGIKDYATYDMTFSVHKRMKLVATGEFVDEKVDADKYVSRWESKVPMSVAGFTLGLFKRDEAKVGDSTIVALANVLPSNLINQVSRVMANGSYDTASSNRLALNEATFSMQLFNDYFGPLTLKRIHITQQTACNYGQAWPGVLYIPTCYYWSPTLRNQLGIQFGSAGYWESVASHEVAHLWWGHAVGWNSYRDQWMSEGFAHLSASLFLQAAYPKEPQKYRNFWKQMQDDITQKNQFGFRPNDVGPLTQGYRLNSGRTGAVATSVIYPKGAYVLHMLRMMMWTRDGGDARFKAMLRDFIETNRNQPVTTEDFKAAVEKHIIPEMDLDGDGTMNWFFRQFVYGTELPGYKLQQSVASKDGQSVISMKLTQSNVSDGFKMKVPLYLEFQDGRVVRIGAAGMVGNSTVEQDIPVGQLPVKRLLINYYYDVLTIEDK